MKTGSAPGPDGFPAEFYRTFWDVLGNYICAVLREFFTEHRLPESFRRGRIILLPKEGGDPNDPGAWRPITLLNASYKLLASIITQRLHGMLPDVVTPHQTCSIVGRSIQTLTSLTKDVVQYTNARQARGLIASLDQAKAFDRVEHPFLLAVLTAFGIPPEGVRLFETLYSDMKSDLYLNGGVTASFPVTRPPGRRVRVVASGLPALAPAASFSADSRLPGNGEVKVSAYADDITLYLRDTDDLGAALRIFETYGSLSGARLNEQKSAVLWVNRPPDPSSPIPAKTSVTILGVTYRSSGISADMWTRLARDIGEKVDSARTYALPLAERRYLAYSVFCGRLWYLAQTALPTSRFIRPVKSALYSFFWSEKTELVTRPVVCLPRERGGWGFPCVDIAPAVLQLKTMLKILRDEHGPARSLALYFVGHSRRELGVESPSSPGPCAETPPSDYRRAIQLFKRLKERAPQLDVVETPTARLTEVLLEPQISATQPSAEPSAHPFVQPFAQPFAQPSALSTAEPAAESA
ncbi:hypothetical protein ISCGN_008359 [Ixodes scapularis]